jgi:hypothetical protein
MARPASYTPIGSPYDVPLVLQARTDSVEGRTVRSSDEIVAALEESLQGRFAV